VNNYGIIHKNIITFPKDCITQRPCSGTVRVTQQCKCLDSWPTR